jgi:hypothetical protein
MQRRISFAASFMTTAIVAAITLAACISLDRWQVSENAKLLAAHQKSLAAVQERFEVGDTKRQIEVHDANIARQRRFQQEITTALGGPVGVALKHPELTILGMLQEVARACAPPGSVPHAAVDRFTEFTLFIDLPAAQDRSALGEIARCLLTHSAQYLGSVQFSHDRSVLAVLDRRGIESIADWANASTSAVEKALIDPEYSQPLTFVGAVAPAAEQQIHEFQNLPEEGRRQRMAEERFAEVFKLANSQLRSALERQIDAVNLAGVKRVGELDERGKILMDAERIGAEAKRVLANPILEYERILEAQKLDPIYIRAALRTATQNYADSRPAAGKVFAGLDERSRCASEFLATMKRHFGAWTYQPFQDRFEFHETAAQLDYAAASKKFATASRTLEHAIAEWARALDRAHQSSQTEKKLE